MIELAVFDMAGTTVHDGNAVNDSFRAALAAADVASDPARVNLVMGLPKPEAIRILLIEAGREPAPAAIDAIHADFVKRMRTYYATSPDIREVPGAAAVFAALRKMGVKIALNTGFNRAITDVLLERLGWRVPDVIDGCVCSDEVPHGRPHPDMIRLLMSRLNVRDALSVAKIGDTWADLEEGVQAGCALNIGVTSGAFSREQLLSRPHSHIVESVVQVPEIIRQWNARRAEPRKGPGE